MGERERERKRIKVRRDSGGKDGGKEREKNETGREK